MPAADIVFTNGVVLTRDPVVPLVQAVAVRDGRIQAMGTDNEMAAYIGSDTQVIDLQGHVLMPGFVDAHTHFFNYIRDHDQKLQDTQLWLLSQGVTTVTEANVGPDLFEWMLNAYESGDLTVRVAVYLAYTNACGDILGHWYLNHPSAHLMDDSFRVPGIKIFADGGSCNGPAVSFEYSPGDHGSMYFNASDLSQVILEAEQNGYQVAIHALGDLAVEMVLDAYQLALNGAPNNFRHRIEHSALLRDELLPRYGEINIVPVLFGKAPTCYFTGDTSQFSFLPSEEFLPWEWRYGDLIATNPDLPYAWHSDYPVYGSINPFEHLYGFVTRKEVNAEGKICEPPDWEADDVIPVDQALYFMTSNSAYATFYDDIVGSITPGKYADMIILSDNPLVVDPDDLINITVKMTMLGGNVVYCADGQEDYCPINPK